jgi:hypothetical protein
MARSRLRRSRVRVGVAALVVVTATALLGAPAASGAAEKAEQQPPIGHVFVVNLENKSFDQTWGPHSPAPYLSRTLRRQGVFLDRYYAVAHKSLGNYVAQISGQGPSRATQADCSRSYSGFRSTGRGADGQVLGDGCVYPRRVKTLADQLTARNLTWKGYMEDMNKPCLHPAIGRRDPYVNATESGAYVTRHNPFVYFHSIIDSPSCAENDVPLAQLEQDLSSIKTTANFNLISPNVCNDGHDATCPGGAPGGLAAANTWLQTWVPKITSSPAFKKDGLLVVTFDEAEIAGDNGDSSSCCNEQQPPTVEQAGLNGPGGGRVGAVLISRFIEPGSTSSTPYNHYALLCSIENLFGLKKLGYAGASGLACFGSDVYTNPSGNRT